MKNNKSNTASRKKSTPLMEQYLSIKANYQDMILLYRMGDFYETFNEDAKTISKVLGIALTRRSHGKSADVPLAGFPYHALDAYLPKLVKAGYKVAICEQVEDPRTAKSIVKRKVIEVVTPGAALSEKLLNHQSNNFLAAISIDDSRCGVSYADVSTGEFFLSEIPTDQLQNYLQEINAREILVPSGWKEEIQKVLGKQNNALISTLDDWIFSHTFGYETLTGHFKVSSLKGFGADEFPRGVVAAGAVLHYLKENYQNQLEHIRRISVISPGDFMILDATTRRNLEITAPIIGAGKEGTLISILDATMTPMGSRLLKQWITHPLINFEKIKLRHSLVDSFFALPALRNETRELLENIGDMERLLGRISTGRANGRDMAALRNSLSYLQPIQKLLSEKPDTPLYGYSQKLKNTEDILELLQRAIVDSPPATITEGNVIRENYDTDLDELRAISRDGKTWIVELQNREREKSGIPSLKIGYNKVFGYYFEVTRTHLDKVPDYFIRKQTLVNAERYITPDLKELEEKVLGAEEKISALEYELFQKVREAVTARGEDIQWNSRIIAELDCFANLAHLAQKYHYIRPEMTEGTVLKIEGGRHPVVERLLPPDESFVENDIRLDNEKKQIIVLTGPNMSGKSTYLRQTGLIVLMAQIGSFVPARTAEIGLVDRIFTRVGASDNLAFGESTFMVEMLETANILHNATPASLILLDEIGRGTSTYDGLSIAWAVTEYLHNEKSVAAKTLFATHYHELTELAMIYPRIHNFQVVVKEYEDHVVFMRKIAPGGMDNSYGIYVAQMAGLPQAVVARAREVLHNLESNELSPNNEPKLARRSPGMGTDKRQLNLFETAPPSPVEEALKKVDINRLTPLEALVKLNELRDMIQANSK